ncbi:histidine phosphatase family protein [Micrococcales bacterium 31B]|nr:histidine phosphatase family protein [Micrococcales bacterium 31B]
MRILLIRHGQTSSNVSGALDTARPGAPLTALGESQARAIPIALQGRTVSGIYVSPLRRTHETAAPLAAELGLAPVEVEGLEEIVAGDLEMRTDSDSVAAYLAAVGHWLAGAGDHRVPGGEGGHEFLGRFDAALRGIAARHGGDDEVVVVSHGAAIRAYAGRLEGNHSREEGEQFLRNTGMVELDVQADGTMRVVSWRVDPLGGPHLADATAHDVTGEGDGSE